MAFCLLVEPPLGFQKWEDLSSKMRIFALHGVESFPILDMENSGSCYVGLSIPRSKEVAIVIEIFIECIFFLLEEKCKVFELYSSLELTKENALPLAQKFFVGN
ncbi:hypothetical protein [Filimonas effusa]|uniref:Uncharacterized protein n=1 Tax=Filimonas effusa TaxID=2508721 RepID=A0A4Q1D7L2_9BACT|nr:hypothetical protein [Filimonas effusa]RXK85274.1 hypothetical protein ESB13_00135 [Filimonas effusa]